VSKVSYKVTAKVDQIVTREVHLVVTAGTEEEAEAKAREALQLYPQAIDPVLGVTNLLTVKQNFWIPKSVDIVKIKQEK
jgi:hypothetical protein